MTVTALSKRSDFSGVLTFVAPTGGVTVDVPVKIQSVIVVPNETASAGASFQGTVLGAVGRKVFHGVTKKSGAAWTVGQQLYFHATDGFQTTATSVTACAIAAAAAGSSDTTGDVVAFGS
jgi:hypothetical protein